MFLLRFTTVRPEIAIMMSRHSVWLTIEKRFQLLDCANRPKAIEKLRVAAAPIQRHRVDSWLLITLGAD